MKKIFVLYLFILASVCILLLSACSGKQSSNAAGNPKCKHVFGDWETVTQATCKEKGKSARTCEKCDYTEEKVIQKSKKHNEVIDTAVAATCTEDGKSEGKHCSVCAKIITPQKTIKAKGHVEVIDSAIDATCTAEGKTQGKHCSVCNTVIVAQKSIPKTEHVYKNQYKCSCGEYLDSAKLVIMTQNVRCVDDGENKNIVDRAPRFKLLVDKYAPDIIGTQEVTPEWNEYFEDFFQNTYDMVGCSREGENATHGEWGTILYRRDRFKLLDSGNFWLSKTPYEVSSIDGSLCNRICTWALLTDKNTGKTFVIANTHLDHSTDDIRKRQLYYLFKELSDLMKQYPIFLTGDFNTNPGSVVYADAVEKLRDPYISADENRSSVDHTFHNYGHNGSLIDYCFFDKRADALWYKIADEQFGGYVSDHYAVLVEAILK